MAIYRRIAVAIAALVVTVQSSFAAPTVPAELPRPDDKAPAKDKPVKVYILSGQSNSLGFGRADGGAPTYPSIFLSADPTIKTCMMPVGSSGLLPHLIFRDADGQTPGANAHVYKGGIDRLIASEAPEPAKETIVALGDASKDLPGIDGPHTVVVEAFIEVPITGAHEVHVGFGDSSYAIATIDGNEVYRKGVGNEAVVTRIHLEKAKRYPLRIAYRNGGSAAFWMELVDLKPKGTLEYHIKEESRFTCFVNEKGEWNTRNDVIICDAYMGKGKNQPLGAMWRNGSFGPELAFGYVMGTFHDEPVIVMKADIGNRSLAWDCLPPGSKRYTAGDMVYAGYKDTQSSWPAGEEPKPGGWYAGKQYDDYTKSIHDVLDNFDEKFPQFRDQGYEIAGFVWWQGHKDQNDVHASRYEQNLVNLINAWRKEFNAPDAKFAIATIAFGGWTLSGPGKTIAEAQLAVDGNSGKYPQFKGNVKTIEARNFWRDPGESPKNQGYHYNHNGETYFLVGDALGRAMVEMMGGKAEKRQLPTRPKKPDTWPENLTLKQTVQMLYSDAFISPWSKDPAEPTKEDFEEMVPALRPIIMGKLIPEYVAAAPKVPAYRRHGLSLVPIVSGKAPQKRVNVLKSQLDKIIGYYNAAGIHDYDWKRFGPDMQNARWHYYSFDPPEKPIDNSTNQYRPITYPKGMANWYAADFNPAKTGWKEGKAPFGQNNGEQKALRSSCSNPQCGCDITPRTLWEEEVLLMSQTFDLPKLSKDHRYRLVVSGGNHAWAGEGFAVYVNGKLFAEAKGGFYKSGGTQGAYVFNDFLPEFQSGKVTIAVKGFLRRTSHRNKPAPPRGHLSVWMEAAKIPEVVLQTIGTAKK